MFGWGANFKGWEGIAVPGHLVLAFARSIITIVIIIIFVIHSTLKSGTFGVPGLVLPGHGTAWDKSGTSREIQDGWQPY